MTNHIVTICSVCHGLVYSDYDVEVAYYPDGHEVITCHRCLRKRTQPSPKDWRPAKTEKED